ncbi:MAG: HAD-IC family P-type ATPase [Propionibacteriaceae bacterium]|nr:HAD-IC family P-type ATPase [Propionibacteriaceae bacterium]
MTVEPTPGLSSAEVRERIEAGNVNTLPSRSGRSASEIIIANVFTRVNVILFVLFVIVMSTGEFEQGIFGMLIIANSIIGIIQELRAKRTLDNLAVIGEAHPVVLRDGIPVQLPRDQVVQDDVIRVHPGDQVVVDGQVVDADYLEVDESMLTGEADTVTKMPGDEVLSGAFVVSGTGTYRAEKVGADAYAAQITAQAAKFTLVSSELRQGVDRIIRFVSFLMVPVAGLTVWVQFQQVGSTWQESVLSMTAALVPMIPEGLVLLTSMAFALGVVRLGRRNCLVQELPAIEGLARVSVVCTDKTGTLTQHGMTLGEIIPLAGSDLDVVRDVLGHLVGADPAPNASMQAIAAAVPASTVPWTVQARAPFTSARKYSGVSFHGRGNWLLGAPEVLSTSDGTVAALAEETGSSGRRVLLLAGTSASVDHPEAAADVAPMALLVLDQKLRPDAADTIDFFASQGVEVKVISGDNASSVGAVASTLGMTGAIRDARTLPEDDAAFSAAVEDAQVFGRVTPPQKKRMVQALQSSGHSVAMTGDGVNDVLALKEAHLGVAMGSGSPATRAVAQVVLLDDRFETLPHVVAEGRRVIGNVERVAKLFLTKTVYAVTLALVLGLLGLPNPFVPLQITVIGWFTIGIPAFLLSLAPNNDRARTGFVRRVLAVGVPSGVIVATATIVTFLMTRGLGPVHDTVDTQATTATLAALIISAVWVVSIVARPFVAWRLGMVVFGYVFYTGVFIYPPTQRLLELDISNPATMTVGIVTGLIAAAAIEATWWITARIRHERPVLWRTPGPPPTHGRDLRDEMPPRDRRSSAHPPTRPA